MIIIVSTRILILILITFPVFVKSQGQVIPLPILSSTSSSVSLNNDSNYILSTYQGNKLYWLRADLKQIGSKNLKTNLELRIRYFLATKTNIYVTGLVFPKSTNTNSPAWIFLTKLDSCFEPIWQKMIEIRENYFDTSVFNNTVGINSITIDEKENLYLLSVNENLSKGVQQLELNRATRYLYKFSSDGVFKFRNQFVMRNHSNLNVANLSYSNGKLYFTGDAFFPANGESDSTNSLMVLRGIVASIDTSGFSANIKVFEDELDFANAAYFHKMDNKNNKLLLSQYGRYFKGQKSHRVARELIMDLNLNVTSLKISSEKDSLYFYSHIFYQNKNGEYYCFKKLQQTSQPGDVYSRTGYGYLFKVDSNLNTLDSFAIDFFTPSNDKDSQYNVLWILQNPLIDTVLTFFGTSNQNSPNFYFFGVNVNSKGQAIDSFNISRFPDLSCSLDYSESSVFLGAFDTLVITTKFNQYFKNPANSVDKKFIEVFEKPILFPNPVNDKICFANANVYNEVMEAELTSTDGRILEKLNKTNDCFTFKPIYFGPYILKATLKSQQILHYKITINP
ncbi:MAG: hypothetical protein FGM41_05015 [Bacteroidetes bacterium]|nr:hypothetical protein [Bacteroidota bacterium]